MTSNTYHFTTHWRMRSTREEIYEVLSDAVDLTRWWPSVYLDVRVLEPGDAQGIGRVVSLYTKGWLPYTLRWQFRVTEAAFPTGFALQAWGDFVGGGVWRFEQDGDWANIRYDWSIAAEKSLLRRFSFLFKPIFSANHRWAMAKGEESLRLELARRQARSTAERSRIAEPPRPTFSRRLPAQER